ncbi:MAG: cobalamin-dependent protein [Rhodoglobus sp.]
MKKSHIAGEPLVLAEADADCDVLLIHAPYPAQPRFDGLPSSLLSACESLLHALAGRGVRVGLLDPVATSEAFYTQLERILLGGATRVVLVSTSTAAIEETARIVALARRLRPQSLIVVGGPHEDGCDLKVAEAMPEVDLSIAGDAGDVLAGTVASFLELAPSNRSGAVQAVQEALTRPGISGRGTVTMRAWGTSFGRPFDFSAPEVRSFLQSCAPTKLVQFDVFPGRGTVPLTISRGCAYGRCTFCSEGAPDLRIRLTADLGWIERLLAAHPTAAFYFQDSIFPMTKQVRRDLLPMLREAGVPWGCQAYLPMLSEPMVRALEAHGCTYVYTGIESGSDRILQAIGKPELTQSVIRQRLGWFKGSGMRVGLSLMFGAMTETGQLVETTSTVAETVLLAEALVAAGVPVAAFYPNVQTVLPGTAVARGLAKAGHELDFYRLPRTAAFEHMEDGAFGYTFLTLPIVADTRDPLTETVTHGSERIMALAEMARG